MISAEELKTMAKSLLGNSIPSDVWWDSIAEQLSAREDMDGTRLSAYGFLLWAIERYGTTAVYKNVLTSRRAADGYADDALKHQTDMPSLLYNAHIYTSKLMGNVADMSICFKHLEGMTFPYVLYVLFASSGQQDIVKQYKPNLCDMLRKYPSLLDNLPESYRNTGKEVMQDADT